jgi:DoxX-like family
MDNKKLRIAGYVLSAMATLVLVGSAAGKMSGAEKVIENMNKSGIPLSLLTPFAAIEIVAVVLFWIPRTALVGLGLMVAYLGGAVFAHVRGGEAFAAPVVIGLIAAAGLTLRSNKLRDVVLGGA